MHWDRKILAFGLCAIILAAAVLGIVLYKTNASIIGSGERIAGLSEEGFEKLSARLESGVVRVSINRRGKYESQRKYRDFSVELLSGMTMSDAAFLYDSLEYTHTIKLVLKRNPDEAGVFESPEAMFFKNGGNYYVGYTEGGVEYRFCVTCPALTEWLDGITDTKI